MEKKILLIIEDDKLFRELITLKLNLEGYQISEAVDGEEGIKKVKEEKPDLVLLDLLLPGIDGFGVLENIKNEPSLFQTKVIILSNLDQKADVEKGLKLGATDFLVKSQFTPGEIIERIKEILK